VYYLWLILSKVSLSWVDRFLEDCRLRGLAVNTINNYRKLLRCFVSSYGVDLGSCSRDELLRFMEDVSRRKRSYHGMVALFVRQVLRFLGRHELVDLVIVPKGEDWAAKIKDKVLNSGEVKKLIDKAPTDQDRLLIQLFYETGARRREIYDIRIKDVQFDKYGALIWVSGKSGTRTRRVYGCAPELKNHINSHPEKDNPEARLFHYSHTGSSDFSEQTLYWRVRWLGRRILKKNVYPHMLRHTKATDDSKYFTDRELMKLYGWKSPVMVNIYSHLTMKDVEDKDLVLHGLKSKEEILKPLIEVRKCFKCGSENAPVSVYCHKCGQVLGTPGLEDTQKEMRGLEDQIKNLTSQVYLIRLEKDESEPFTIPDGLDIDYDRWLSKNENWIQLNKLDPELAKKHYESSELRLHIEMRKEGEEGEIKAFTERQSRKVEARKKLAEFKVKKPAKRVRYVIVDRKAKRKK
jgi:integrase/recombinase XerD